MNLPAAIDCWMSGIGPDNISGLRQHQWILHVDEHYLSFELRSKTIIQT